jgi:hypothetical protein
MSEDILPLPGFNGNSNGEPGEAEPVNRIADVADAPKKRGRPAGSKNKPKAEGEAPTASTNGHAGEAFPFGANEATAPPEPATTSRASEGITPAPEIDPTDLEDTAGDPIVNGPDRLDPADLADEGAEGGGLEVAKLQLVIPVSKPKGGVFVRTHPDPGYTQQITGLEVPADIGTEFYVLWGSVRHAQELLMDKTYRRLRVTAAITTQGDLFLWTVKVPSEDAGSNIRSWYESSMEAMRVARDNWIRVDANTKTGGYDLKIAMGDYGDPKWPATSWPDILTRAFKGRVIQDLNHIVCKKLRGEA